MSPSDAAAGHNHHGPHGHRHPPQADIEDGPMTYHQGLGVAVSELLIEKGVFTADQLRATIERMQSANPGQGARIAARAWVDPDYKTRLMSDSRAAAAELGIDTGPAPVIVLEDTANVHNVIVCTLCSCYPRHLLGMSPPWYKSREYRSRVVRDPRAVLAEFGTTVPDGVEVRVHDSTADMRYMVLPLRPAGTDGWSEADLANLVTRDTMIGVAFCRLPDAA